MTDVESDGIIATYPQLGTLHEPWVVVSVEEASAGCLARLPSAIPDICVTRLDGRKISSSLDLHMALYNAFQFPPYYGMNYHAAVDSLFDLSWCEKDHRVFALVVLFVEEMLEGDYSSEDHPFPTMIDISLEVSARVAEEYHWSYEEIRPPSAFKLVLHASTEEDRGRIATVLREMKIEFGNIP